MNKLISEHEKFLLMFQCSLMLIFRPIKYFLNYMIKNHKTNAQYCIGHLSRHRIIEGNENR